MNTPTASDSHIEWRYLLAELRAALRIGQREGRSDITAKTITVPWACWDRLLELATKEEDLGCLECGQQSSMRINGFCLKCDKAGTVGVQP